MVTTQARLTTSFPENKVVGLLWIYHTWLVTSDIEVEKLRYTNQSGTYRRLKICWKVRNIEKKKVKLNNRENKLEGLMKEQQLESTDQIFGWCKVPAHRCVIGTMR